MSATVQQLIDELMVQIQTLPTFVDKSFSIYNVEELQELTTEGYPMVGVAYEGCAPKENKVDPRARGQHAAALLTVSFTVILAVEYRSTLHTDDTKQDALNLMDSIRQTLLGYTGVNSRPWTLEGEFPLEGGLEGVIFYGQLWQTDIAVTGNPLHP